MFFVLLVSIFLISGIVGAEDVDILVPDITGVTEITADGSLADWVGVPGFFIYSTMVADADDIAGEADVSATAWVAYDQDNFYLAVRINDDSLIFEQSGGDIWNGDCVEVWIGDSQTGFTINADGDEYVHNWRGGFDTDLFDFAVVEELNGWTVEAIIPLTELEKVIDVGSGQEFRLAIGINDADQPGAGRSGQIYFPDTWSWGATDTFAQAVFE